MTRVDKYLEKYLDGSISAEEIEEFRELLASDPRLEQELAETLELRSILHDDLLEIEPPSELSSRVEAMVGERFAALAYANDSVTTEEDEDNRRGVLLPWYISGRMAGSMAVAAIALLMIALAPTVTFQSGSPSDRIAPITGGEIGSIDLDFRDIGTPVERDVPSASTTRSNADPGLSVSRTIAAPRSSSSDAVAFMENDRTAAVEIDGPVDPVDATLPEEPRQPVDAREAYLAENSIEGLRRMLNTPTLLERTIAQDRHSTFARDGSADLDSPGRIVPSREELADLGGSNSRGLTLALGGDSENDPLSAALPSRRVLEDEKEKYQRLMIGGTLVSGVNSRSTNLSVEGSAYLALGLDEKSRIGLEGGSATFRYRRDVPVEIHTPATTFAARGVVNNDGEEDEGDGMVVGAGGDGPQTRGSEGGVLNPGGTPVRGANDLDQPLPPQEDRGPTRGRVEPGFNVSYGFESHETEASMVYGLVFYDHTVTSLSDRLNLNGRIGVGGTDGGMVVSARAYAAISSHENIAWTLGLGGSMLHDFAGEIDFNAMYGLNAGVQFGF